MAVPWLAVLTSVPWSGVISNASKIVDGARRLWDAALGNPEPAVQPKPHPASPDTAKAIAEVEARLAVVESALSELNRQMRASSELIKELAEQNALLVARIEADRQRMAWLTGVAAVAAVAALASLVAAFLR